MVEANERTKELRLGVVCYGGVSLAIYIHGVTKELHKLVVASKACESFDENPFDASRVEYVYWDMLKGLERKQGVGTRVVIDVIAGTSAGGINGIILAKALSGHLSQDMLKHIWLEKADIRKLMGGLQIWGGGGCGGEAHLVVSDRDCAAHITGMAARPRPRRPGKATAPRGPGGALAAGSDAKMATLAGGCARCPAAAGRPIPSLDRRATHRAVPVAAAAGGTSAAPERRSDVWLDPRWSRDDGRVGPRPSSRGLLDAHRT